MVNERIYPSIVKEEETKNQMKVTQSLPGEAKNRKLKSKSTMESLMINQK